MKRGIKSLTKFRLAFVFALIFCLSSSQIALAEYITVFGGAGYVLTGSIYYLGAGNLGADSKSHDNYGDETMLVNSRGYNNAGNPAEHNGWHLTGSAACNEPSPGDCAITTPADGQTSGSSDHYVTAEHYFIWGSGSEVHYTSSDGARSSSSCWITPGC